MKLITLKLASRMPALYATESVPAEDKIVQVIRE